MADKYIPMNNFLSNNYSNYKLLACLYHYDELLPEDIVYISDKLTNSINDENLINIIIYGKDEKNIKIWFKAYIDSLNLCILDYAKQINIEIFKLILKNDLTIHEGFTILNYIKIIIKKDYTDSFYNFYDLYEYIFYDGMNKYQQKKYIYKIKKYIYEYVKNDGNYDMPYTAIYRNVYDFIKYKYFSWLIKLFK